ncbi:MAG: superoxide dismutase [Rhodospirillaceae bacterium]|nr:superoxide dismutase [Rhodospirillaceae bacterium]
MKVFVTFTRKAHATAEDFQRLIEAEDKYAFALYGGDKIREMYSRADGQGAIAVLECDDADHANALMAELPMVKKGLLDVECHGALPYAGIAALGA